MAMQIRISMTQAQLAAERKRSNSRDAMLTSDMARPIGITVGTSKGGTRKPRYSDGKVHPCLVTRADGTQSVIIPGKGRNVSTRTRKPATIVDMPHRTTAADLPAIFAD